MSVSESTPQIKKNATPSRTVRLGRKAGGFFISFFLGRAFHITQDELSQIENGLSVAVSRSPLDRMAKDLEMTPDTLLHCLGLGPKDYLRRVFGLSGDQAEAAVWFIRKFSGQQKDEAS